MAHDDIDTTLAPYDTADEYISARDALNAETAAKREARNAAKDALGKAGGWGLTFDARPVRSQIAALAAALRTIGGLIAEGEATRWGALAGAPSYVLAAQRRHDWRLSLDVAFAETRSSTPPVGERAQAVADARATIATLRAAVRS